MTTTPTSTPAAAPTLEDLARDVCSLATRAGMPDSYWLTDSRVARACLVLGITPAQARDTDWSVRPAAPAAETDPDFDEPTTVPSTPVGDPTTGPLFGVTEVWTDGACRHNPGPGGWGWVCSDGRHGSGALAGTTNNVMELTAVIEAVKAIPERPLVVVSDSRYVVDAFQKRWWRGWLTRDWKTSSGGEVKNRALWEDAIDLIVFGGVTAAENPARRAVDTGIEFRWVKGHSGDVMNDEADRLAVAARESLPHQGRGRA